jgi:hypothetical protein
MSEEKKKEIEVEVKVDRSAELDALNQEVATLRMQLENEQQEKANLESQLEIIAEKELNAKSQRYGIDPNLSDSEKIKQIKEHEEKEFGGNSAPLYGQQTEVKVRNDREFDSIEDLHLTLEKESRDDSDPPKSAIAKAILGELGKKELQTIKTGARTPLSVDIDPKMLKQLRDQELSERSKKLVRR